MSDSIPFDHLCVGGTAKLSVLPDIATITVALREISHDLAAAKRTVDERSSRVIELAKKLGIDLKDVTATQIAIGPEYEWKAGNERQFKGSFVSRDVTVILRDLGKYSTLIHGFAEVPITSLSKAKLDVSDRSRLEKEVLLKAIGDARETATSMAAGIGMKLGHFHSINSQRTYHIGGVASYDADAERGSFEIGTIEISREINCVFRLDGAA